MNKENNNIKNNVKIQIGISPNISSRKIINNDIIIKSKPNSPINSRINSAKAIRSKPNSPNPNMKSFKISKKVENDDNKLFKKVEVNNNKVILKNNNNNNAKSVTPISIINKSEQLKPEPPVTTKPIPKISNRTSFSCKSRKIREKVVMEVPIFLTEINEEEEEERKRIEQEEIELKLQKEKLEAALILKIKLEKEEKVLKELKLKQETAAIIIQRNYWKLIESREYLLQVEERRLLLIIKLQKYVRNIFLPYQKYIDSIIRLQSLLRGWISCRRVKTILYNNLCYKSSIIIQSYVRSWLCCKRLKQKWMDNIRHKIQMKLKFEYDIIREEKKKLRLKQEKRMKAMSEARQINRPLLSEDIQNCQNNLENFMIDYKKPHKPTNSISTRLYQPKINKIAILDEEIKKCESRIEKVLTQIKPNKIIGIQKVSPRLYQAPNQKKIEEVIVPLHKLTREEKKLKRKNIMIKKELKKLSKEFSRSKFNLLPDIINNTTNNDNNLNIISYQIENALKCTNSVLNTHFLRFDLGIENINNQNYNINNLLSIDNDKSNIRNNDDIGNNLLDKSLKISDFEQNITSNILQALNKVNKCIELSDIYDDKMYNVIDNPKKIDSMFGRSNDIEFSQLYRQNRRLNDNDIENY